MSKGVAFTNNSDGALSTPGFFGVAGHADIRNKGNDRLDTGVLYSETPCVAAGVFTKNAVKAAPVLQNQEVLSSKEPIYGIVANSGNANACTGPQGKADAKAMEAAAAEGAGDTHARFFVSSTGRIGDLLPMGRMEPVIKDLAAKAKGGTCEPEPFAKSILTSDTKPKTCSATFEIDGMQVTVGGTAKGAGMIQPNMATMLAFLTTDIEAEQQTLQSVLDDCVKVTFNAITVDGDMSTNDTVLVLANGRSGVRLDDRSIELFKTAVLRVCDELADKIVADGEMITKVVEILIKGASTDSDAENIARAIGNSLLVKTSWYGNDPNWGRLMDALGYADAKINPDTVDISYEDIPALVSSTPVPENKPRWKEVVSKRRFTININMNLGESGYRLRASDLTEGYVDFNKSE